MLSKVSTKSPNSDTRPTQTLEGTLPLEKSGLKTKEVACAALLEKPKARNERCGKMPMKQELSYESNSEDEELHRDTEELHRDTMRVVLGALGDVDLNFSGRPVERRHSR